MTVQSTKSRLLASATIAFALAASFGGVAFAADGQSDQANATDTSKTSTVSEIVVTGSRIKRSATDSPAPIDLLSKQDLVDRGFTNAGDLVNLVTTNTPSFAVTPTSSGPAGGGQTYPNLFNLGAGRTLTLVNGQRVVSTSTPITPSSAAGFGSGQGGAGNGVDTGIIPIGLLDHIEVVEAGGAAVYGSDAIAGVVNYVMKQHFTGLEVDGQAGTSWKGDHDAYSARITAGTDFADGRGNIAADFEWSKSDPLLQSQRNYPEIGRFAAGLQVMPDAHFYAFNKTGVLFSIPAPVPICSGVGGNCFVNSGGGPIAFSADGSSLVAYNPGLNASGGQALSPPFANGGDGYALRDLTALATGIHRRTLNVLGHYDITDHIKLSASVVYDHEVGYDPIGSQGVFRTVLSPAPDSALLIFKSNPYLTSSEIAEISAADPTFAHGGPVWLSKAFINVLPTQEFTYPTNTYEGHIGLDGDFNQWNRDFTWSVGYSHGEVESYQNGWDVYTTQFANALSAAKNGAGQIVCSINAVTVTDPNCAPINPFGNGPISAAAAKYVDAPIGYHYSNREDDFLALFGGDLVHLPGGEAKFSVGYEFRNEYDSFTPSDAQRAGLNDGSGGTLSPVSGGSYETNEFSGELLAPILGDNFTMAPIKGLDFTAQGRTVDNSIAGRNTVWGLGLNLRLEGGLTLRASRSQNFRAPTLYQLFAPTSTTLAGGVQDPCDPRYINTGPSPSTRAANCAALFAANPTYGTGPGEAAPGSSVAQRLAAFTDTAVNFSTAEITSSGNTSLKNEVSETFTYGFVWQPTYVPGNLTITADYISVNILNGLTAFTPTNFAQSCFDNAGGTSPTCGFFTRDAFGNIATATQTTYNAASLKYKGETANIDYRFPVEWLVRRPDSGNLELQLELTHNDTLKQNVDGAVTQVAGTIAEPRWVARTDVRYNYGPFRFTYEAFYLPSSLAGEGDNASNTALPVIKSNLEHSISASYDFGHFRVRAGVNNLTNEPPSVGTLTYGDYIGRTFWLGLTAKY
ncbi:MAG TPA: TonB-dependent receptor [Caulobacteraceae bacterium]|nr:TonB-dependent receptor [Caulobacteraceae bacterium]